MAYEDKVLICLDCDEEFDHTAEDQKRYASRGFTNEPKRCRPCREKRKANAGGGGGGYRGGRDEGSGGGGGYRGGGQRGGGGGYRGGRDDRGGGFRESFDVVCAECGVQTTVPFKPTGERPVYCRDCFRSRRD